MQTFLVTELLDLFGGQYPVRDFQPETQASVSAINRSLTLHDVLARPAHSKAHSGKNYAETLLQKITSRLKHIADAGHKRIDLQELEAVIEEAKAELELQRLVSRFLNTLVFGETKEQSKQIRKGLEERSMPKSVRSFAQWSKVYKRPKVYGPRWLVETQTLAAELAPLARTIPDRLTEMTGKRLETCSAKYVRRAYEVYLNHCDSLWPKEAPEIASIFTSALKNYVVDISKLALKEFVTWVTDLDTRISADPLTEMDLLKASLVLLKDVAPARTVVLKRLERVIDSSKSLAEIKALAARLKEWNRYRNDIWESDSVAKGIQGRIEDNRKRIRLEQKIVACDQRMLKLKQPSVQARLQTEDLRKLSRVMCTRAFAKSELRLYQEAVTDFDAAITMNKWQAAAYRGRALAKEQLGRSDEAKRDLELYSRVSRYLIEAGVGFGAPPNPDDVWR